MAFGQYQVTSYEQSLDSQAVENRESTFPTPNVKELNEATLIYELVKAIEAKIDKYRSLATEANLPKTSAVEKARAALRVLLG